MNHRDWDTAHLRPLEDRDIVRGTFVVALRGNSQKMKTHYLVKLSDTGHT